jgi:hypothetical protein
MSEASNSSVSPLDRLIAVEDIRKLRARFARALDLKEWATLRACLTDDCHFDCTQEEGVAEPWLGGDVIVDNISRSLATAVTIHHTHTAEIEIEDYKSATGIWAMQDLLKFPGEPTINVVGYGHYHERYRKEDGGWRICAYKLTRLRVDVSQTAC